MEKRRIGDVCFVCCVCGAKVSFTEKRMYSKCFIAVTTKYVPHVSSSVDPSLSLDYLDHFFVPNTGGYDRCFIIDLPCQHHDDIYWHGEKSEINKQIIKFVNEGIIMTEQEYEKNLKRNQNKKG